MADYKMGDTYWESDTHFVVVNPSWPNGVLPFSERCGGCAECEQNEGLYAGWDRPVDPPEAPLHWDNSHAVAWQQGWAAGYAASQVSEAAR